MNLNFLTNLTRLNTSMKKQAPTSLKLLKSTKDDIISAELVLESSGKTETIDYHEETQKLCVLGDFYEDTVEEQREII